MPELLEHLIAPVLLALFAIVFGSLSYGRQKRLDREFVLETKRRDAMVRLLSGIDRLINHPAIERKKQIDAILDTKAALNELLVRVDSSTASKLSALMEGTRLLSNWNDDVITGKATDNDERGDDVKAGYNKSLLSALNAVRADFDQTDVLKSDLRIETLLLRDFQLDAAAPEPADSA